MNPLARRRGRLGSLARVAFRPDLVYGTLMLPFFPVTSTEPSALESPCDLDGVAASDPDEDVQLEPEDEAFERVRVLRTFKRDRWEIAHDTRAQGLFMTAFGPMGLALGVGIAAVAAPGAENQNRQNRHLVAKGAFTFGIELGIAGGLATIAGLPMLLAGRTSEEHLLRGYPHSKGAGTAASVLLWVSACSLLIFPALGPDGGIVVLAAGAIAFPGALVLEASQVSANRRFIGRLASLESAPSHVAWTVLPTPGGAALVASW
jgi:hypothetical protein